MLEGDKRRGSDRQHLGEWWRVWRRDYFVYVCVVSRHKLFFSFIKQNVVNSERTKSFKQASQVIVGKSSGSSGIKV